MNTLDIEERLRKIVKLTCMVNPDVLRLTYILFRSPGISPFEREHQMLRIVDIVKVALSRAIRHNVFSYEEAMEKLKTVVDAYWEHKAGYVVYARIDDYIAFLDKVVNALESDPRYREWAEKKWRELQSLYKEISSR
jgi:hypothetical protein